ncbi:hypothetical protein NZK35_13830 [Stieleria sp. ICT_E10.1]|nr:hypothetical protein [Stieleria sedimenti]MCS7467728.1 hypothetical protein [Stieleria sedimenti]
MMNRAQIETGRAARLRRKAERLTTGKLTVKDSDFSARSNSIDLAGFRY